ncbi:opsin-5-like [Littorina saxatilis]
MMSLACMSFSRLLSITQPNFARHHGVCIVAVLIAFSVVYSAFWSLCPLLGWGRYDLEPYKTSCTLQWDQPDTTFVTASFIGCLALPALVMCVSYSHITVLALATAARRRRWSKPDSAALTWSRQEVRLVKLTVAMCSVFLLNWCPYVVLAMLKAYRPGVHIPVQLTPLPALAAKCSHLVDPILYCLLNKKFRRLFPRFVTKRKVAESGRDNTNPNVALQHMLQKRVGGGDRWLEPESLNVSLSTGGDKTPVTVTTTFP